MAMVYPLENWILHNFNHKEIITPKIVKDEVIIRHWYEMISKREAHVIDMGSINHTVQSGHG